MGRIPESTPKNTEISANDLLNDGRRSDLHNMFLNLRSTFGQNAQK